MYKHFVQAFWALFLGLVLTAVMGGCKVMTVQTSTMAQANNLGRYYLPRKMMDCTAVYTVTYKDYYEPEKPVPAGSKRKYKKEPDWSRQEIWKIKVADEFPLAFRIEHDPAITYWLSVNGGKLDLFDMNYLSSAPGVISTINASHTPPGEAIATTALKVGAVVVSAAGVLASKSLPSPSPDKKDSVVTTRTEQVSIKKSVDVQRLCPAVAFNASKCGTVLVDSTKEVMKFDRTDLGISVNSTVYVPVVTLRLKRSPFEEDTATLPAEERFLARHKIVEKLKKKPLNGVVYRYPVWCDVTVEVQRNSAQQNVSPSTLVSRTSFPQLGRLGVAPIQFRSGVLAGGKRSTTVSFNTDAGGLTAYKIERTRGTGTAAAEAGNFSKALLEVYGKQQQANSELQQLKDSNALLEEKVKRAKNLKELEGQVP